MYSNTYSTCRCGTVYIMYYDKYGMSSGVVHRQVEGEGGPRGQGRAFPSNQHCPADDSVPNRLSGGGRWKERERERERASSSARGITPSNVHVNTLSDDVVG